MAWVRLSLGHDAHDREHDREADGCRERGHERRLRLSRRSVTCRRRGRRGRAAAPRAMPRMPPTAPSRSRPVSVSSRASAPRPLFSRPRRTGGEASELGRVGAAPRRRRGVRRVRRRLTAPDGACGIRVLVRPDSLGGRAARPGRRRHAQRDQVARRHRRARRARRRCERNRSSTCAAAVGVDRGLAGDHAAQEPARAVDADEAGEAHVAGLALGRPRRGSAASELGTERALAHGGRAALSRDLVGDLGADLVPEAARARCGERLHLQGRVGVVEADGDDALACPPRPRGAGAGPRGAGS